MSHLFIKFCLTHFFQDLSFCFVYDVNSIVVIGSSCFEGDDVIFTFISSSLVPILLSRRLDNEKNVFYFYYMLNCLFLFNFSLYTKSLNSCANNIINSHHRYLT
jgi:hypothetical protein